MSPEGKRARLIDIRDEIDVMRRLTDAVWYATDTGADADRQSDAVKELLGLISDRLKAVVDNLERELPSLVA